MVTLSGKECPNCKLILPSTAIACYCGHNFKTNIPVIVVRLGHLNIYFLAFSFFILMFGSGFLLCFFIFSDIVVDKDFWIYLLYALFAVIFLVCSWLTICGIRDIWSGQTTITGNVRKKIEITMLQKELGIYSKRKKTYVLYVDREEFRVSKQIFNWIPWDGELTVYYWPHTRTINKICTTGERFKEIATQDDTTKRPKQ